MDKLLSTVLLFALWSATPLLAQQEACRSYIADSPEDELVRAVSGAENPQEQVAALDKYAQAHPDSKFMPCVNGFYATAYFKLNNYPKVIEYGEKALASNDRDLALMDNVTYAYVAGGNISDSVLSVILKAADEIKAEANPPRPSGTSDADWQKTLQDAKTQAGEWQDRMARAFFQLVPRLPDPAKRTQALDQFVKAYPDSQNKYAGQTNFNYYLAYKLANKPEKSAEYAEKAVSSDPNNPVALNLVAYDYAIGRTNPDKAAEYAKKAVTLVQTMKKPEGVPDDQFKKEQNNQLGMAHLTLGYVAYLKGSKTHRVAPAIEEFKTAVNLLDGNPELQAQALYYLGYAYEDIYPANHHGAMEALARASNIQSPWQGQARDLLAKVKRVAK